MSLFNSKMLHQNNMRDQWGDPFWVEFHKGLDGIPPSLASFRGTYGDTMF